MEKAVKLKPEITFHLKITPLNPEAQANALAIICAKDNDKAIEMLMKSYKGDELPKASCETTLIDENLEIFNELELEGTPALVFESGVKLAGARTAEEIIRMLEGK
jgi:thiol:disulfide interchange protein DsbC